MTRPGSIRRQVAVKREAGIGVLLNFWWRLGQARTWSAMSFDRIVIALQLFD
jgi:hypothetical protein